MEKVKRTTVFVCERCGAKNRIGKGTFADGSLHVSKAKIFDRINGDDDITFDLCNECKNKLMAWLYLDD